MEKLVILLLIIPLTYSTPQDTVVSNHVEQANYYIFYEDENVTVLHPHDLDTINYGYAVERQHVYDELLYYFKTKK